MVARRNITARQERLGKELRKLRERAGLSLREAARATGINEGKFSNLEAGRVGVSAERVRLLAGHYAAEDAAFVDALAAMTGEQVRGWWVDYRGQLPSGFLDLAELEHHAAHLRSFENVQIPGLLQTEEQVRAIYSVARLPEEQLDARVHFRLRRQEVLGRPEPFRYEVVVHEAALRVRVADRKVARRQLLHIAEQSERPQVAVRVVPFDVDGFTEIGNPTLIAVGPVPQLDTVLLDTVHGGTFMDAEAQLGRYRRVISDVEGAALGVVESRDFIHRLAQCV
ncbi:helix-turn-helix domain-containing protein [Streptomyces piniterrae]|uniref:Helix-turn-helix domain-containing protein n=1 Tax=Streptomyces piniterrae TaxID=2571125 RepID=A0A4U0ML93_9ACTN|nr:helix-turn-helix transcriptional regulator [Streptomyces piniterrae]TJZ41465.1 helix-turn-helix domain-containing protein [Streptomyces piniterrae]